jgi:uncharacterized repeat protein (TIGR03843 family)
MDNHEPEPTSGDVPPSQALTMERILEILETGTFDTEHGMIRWSSNYTFLISIAQDDLTVMGVYKPQQGERPLWDFPDGTLCYRERAAFITSQALTWQLVPPTVLRKGPRGLGSLQFYVDHDPEQHYFTFDESMLPQLMRLALFDYLINNADRKGGHCLVDEQGHLWGIDHGIAFHAAHKLRTVIWNFAGEPIPPPLLDDVDRLCRQVDDPQNVFRCELNQLLNTVEVDAFRRRVHKVLEDRHYPAPGPGPNYPWPPV